MKKLLLIFLLLPFTLFSQYSVVSSANIDTIYMDSNGKVITYLEDYSEIYDYWINPTIYQNKYYNGQDISGTLRDSKSNIWQIRSTIQFSSTYFTFTYGSGLSISDLSSTRKDNIYVFFIFSSIYNPRTPFQIFDESADICSISSISNDVIVAYDGNTIISTGYNLGISGWTLFEFYYEKGDSIGIRINNGEWFQTTDSVNHTITSNLILSKPVSTAQIHKLSESIIYFSNDPYNSIYNDAIRAKLNYKYNFY